MDIFNHDTQTIIVRLKRHLSTSKKLPEEVLILELLQLVKVKSSEFLLPLQSLLITIPLHYIRHAKSK